MAFSRRGQQVYVHLGGEWEGWDEERAAEEQRFLMEKVNRGEWSPPPTDSVPGAAGGPLPTFQVEASEWLYRRRLRAGDIEGKSKTIRDLEWRLSVVMDKFGPVLIGRVDFALADELVVELCEERSAIERAAADGEPLKRTVRTASGRSYEARRRSVSNASMRRALDTAERVLRDAKQPRCADRGGAVAEVSGSEGRSTTPVLPGARADRCGHARCGPHRRRAPRPHMGKSRAHPPHQPLGSLAGARAWRLRHVDRQGPSRRAVERKARSSKPQRRPAARDRRDTGPRWPASVRAM